MAERVTVKRAAEILGVNPLTIQHGIKTGRFSFGVAIPSPTGKRTNIHISPYLLSQYTGLSVEEIKGEKEVEQNN